jgi:hypothetical protein
MKARLYSQGNIVSGIIENAVLDKKLKELKEPTISYELGLYY